MLSKKKLIYCLIISCLILFLFKNFIFSFKDSKNIANYLLLNNDIKINGTRAWDIKVHNEKLYNSVLQNGSLALGESYMDGWWDCDAIDEFIFKILVADLRSQITENWFLLFQILKAKIFNLQSRDRAYQVGQKHYDIGNDLFENMLDERMIYSCAYWKNAKDLNQAQEDKLDLICRKLDLKPGMKVLDIGCGWGGLAYYMALNYDVQVVGLTISKQQENYAKEYCKDLPVKILLQDYRDLNKDEKFDRVVSVGMFEHVGNKNYREYMKIVHSCLKDEGLFLLHTIGGNFSTYSGDPWMNKYIFPNGMLPSVTQIAKAFEGLFILEDWHNFGPDYEKTLKAWFNNFDKNWPKLEQKYGNRFYRMWKYYLLSCAGLFKARKAQLWQIVLSKAKLSPYVSIR